MRKVGLLGGTFDPPHQGHLLIAEEVYHALGLDEVWFVPSHEPPHKKEAKTTAGHRVKMVEEAIKSNSHFYLSTIEMERSGKSYTVDTIRALKQQHQDTDFFFIIGADMVEYLPNWHKINKLTELVNFVGVKRRGYQLITSYPILEVEIPTIDISSTLIRERLLTGKSVRYLVPDQVLKVIKEYHLYE